MKLSLIVRGHHPLADMAHHLQYDIELERCAESTDLPQLCWIAVCKIGA